jgi:hypothetical protein
MKTLQYLGGLAARTRVLDDDDIIGSRLELFGALCHVQNKILLYRELPLLQCSHTGIYRIRITMNEKSMKGTASV